MFALLCLRFVCGPLFDVPPVAFEVSFLQSPISIDDQSSRSLLPRSVEKRPIRLGLEIEIKSKCKCCTMLDVLC